MNYLLTKNRYLHFLSAMLFLFVSSNAQKVQASFKENAGQLIKIGVFNGFQSKNIDSLYADAKGNVSFKINIDNPGIGYLITAENKPYFLILEKGENIKLSGENLSFSESVKVIEGKQNQLFSIYAKEHPRREQALSAWVYLQKIYNLDSLFSIQAVPKNAIQSEMIRIKEEDKKFQFNLDSKSYLHWYLPVRRLVSDVSTIAQYRIEEIPSTIAAFRNIDYTDDRLYKSGLLRDAIDSHFWLLENCGKSLDSVYEEMKTSIDAMMKFLVKDEKKLNEITDYLFDLLEKHSLFKASEYLALKVLNDNSCTINSDLSKQLETYRAMKKGNIAADFNFYSTSNFPGYETNKLPKKLSDLKSKYTLMVFGASWCPKCNQEIPEIASLYAKWKNNGVEVVFVSLDETKEAFTNFSSKFPFISTCDFKKWNSSIVEAYYVFGTPTMFLLDNKREIILRPISVKQVDAWVDWFLLKAK
jgi:thiol-disulfide isomerase/thioredoxin